MSQMKIGEIFSLSQSAVSLIIIQMKNGASPSLKETRGSKPKLSNSQRLELATLLKEPPSDHGFSVWNKWSIQSLSIAETKRKTVISRQLQQIIRRFFIRIFNCKF